MTDAHLPDHGEFVVQTSRNDELKLVRESVAQAHANPDQPGHNWQRIVMRATHGASSTEIVKAYHIDLHAGVVEITETRDGVETARRTRVLDDFG